MGFKLAPLYIFVVLTKVGCSDRAAQETPAQLASVFGRSCELRVDRKWDPQSGNMPQFTHDELSESDYKQVTDGATYSVRFSQDGNHVDVGGAPMSGDSVEKSDVRRVYYLGDGTFAGGRFVVWLDDKSLETELTIYGSGLPIIQSERGLLTCESTPQKDAGSSDSGHQDGGSVAACTPGMDQTCNDDPIVSALWGRCKTDGTCECEDSFIVKTSTGRCTPSPSNSYLLWQGLFGKTGVGAALEVFADGTVNLWAGTTGLQPHKTQNWSTQLKLPNADVMDLFTLLANVDFSILPHAGTEIDCQNKLYLELNPQRPPILIDYKNANNLKPEMDAVYQWIEQHLSSATAILLPNRVEC